MSHLVKKFRIAADRSITFGNFMDKLADMYGDKTCFILDRPMKYSFMTGDRQSYNQWREYTDRVANVLVKDLGVQPGERVIVDMSNRMEIPFTCFALMKIGAVAVPLNFMLTAKEISYIAGDSGAKLMIPTSPCSSSRSRSSRRYRPSSAGP